MRKKIHVNQQYIRKNLKHGTYLPVVTVKLFKPHRKSSHANVYGHEVRVLGESKIIYPEEKMACGARVWIETTAPVVVKNLETGEKVRIE